MAEILRYPQDSEKMKKIKKADKTLKFYPASIAISDKRQRENIEKSPDDTIVLGVFVDEQIEILKGEQFKSAKQVPEDLADYVIRYSAADAPELFLELKADKIFLVRGSWHGTIHFRDEWHNAFKATPKLRVEDIVLVSPFASHVLKSETLKTIKRKPNQFDQQIIKAVQVEQKKSHCWIRQCGAVIVKDKKVLTKGYNKIWPDDGFCLDQGCVRETKILAPNESLELCVSSHAEMSAIGRAAEKGIAIAGATLYTSSFPCPNCAKIIAVSGISEVIFWRDYSSKLGEKILASANIKMTKLKR